jgi:phospholipid/cholesterol/gamma-HCH transport system substrate-binding protein
MSDYETIQKRRDFLVGMFVLAALTAIGWLIFKFGDLPSVVSKWKSFDVYVQFPAAPGVQQDTPVRFAGYQIGRVTEVRPPKVMEDRKTGLKYHQTVVVLSIDKEYDDIPMDVEAKLMTRGLGSSYIDLKVNPESKETRYLGNKIRLQGSMGMTSEFFPEESQKKLEELTNSLKNLVDNANSIIGDEESKKNIKVTVANLSEATKQATETLREFQEFSAYGREAFERLVVSVIDTSEELSMALTQMRSLLEKIDDGEGTTGRLLNDGRLYENLLENTEQLHLFLEEAREFIAEYRKKGVKVQL